MTSQTPATSNTQTPLAFSRSVEAVEQAFQEMRAVFPTHEPQIIQKMGALARSLLELNAQSKALLDQVVKQEGLIRTFSLLSSSLEIEQVLEHVMDTIIDLTKAERVFLMLHDERGDELEIAAGRNWDRANLSQVEQLFSRSVVQSVLNTKEPVITLNALTDDRFNESQSVVQLALRSILCIPLLMQEHVIGILYADNRVKKGIFDQSMIPVLNAFGQQAAAAIVHARQYGAVRQDLNAAQQKLERLEILIDHDKVKNAINDLEDKDYFKDLLEFKRRNTRPIKPG